MRRLTLFASALLAVFSCQHPSGHDIVPLHLSAIYNIDSVEAAMGEGKAIENYKRTKDPAGRAAAIKETILLSPTAKGYFELGSALLDAGQYEEAAEALHIAEQLHYAPLANVMFKLAAVYAPHKNQERDPDRNSQNDSLAIHYMEVAIQMGMQHPEIFLQAPQFAQMKELSNFHTTYNNAFTGGGRGKGLEKNLWTNFTNQFEQARLPLTINAISIKESPAGNRISSAYEKFIPEMRMARFEREERDEYYACFLIKREAAYTALIYGGQNEFAEGENYTTVYYFLATYDVNGKIIDKMAIAGHSVLEAPVKVFTMQPNYTFTVQDFKNIYKDDPQTAGYDSNYVVRTEPVSGPVAYVIGADGKFQKQPSPLAMR